MAKPEETPSKQKEVNRRIKLGPDYFGLSMVVVLAIISLLLFAAIGLLYWVLLTYQGPFDW